MNKSVFFRLTDQEFKILEDYCDLCERSKSDVLRKVIRNLNKKKKPS